MTTNRNPIQTVVIVALVAALLVWGVAASVNYWQGRNAAAAAQVERDACAAGYCLEESR